MITSKTNDYIKHIKSLANKKYRDEYNEYIVEGIKLVKEAVDEKQIIKKIIVSEDLIKENMEMERYLKKEVDNSKTEYVSASIFNYISETKSPQGILAVLEQKKDTKINGNIIFALDSLQDPGNLGTIIRTLDCAGINSLIISKDSADVYNPKVVRSTMGAIFRVNVSYTDNLVNKLLELQKDGYKIIVTSLQAERYIYDLNLKQKSIIVIGNESKGVSESVMNIADIKTKIPMIRQNREP